MKTDPWLEKWIPLLQQKSSRGLILELGCGNGRDTVDLLAAGCNVIATDLSMENLAECADSPSHAPLVRMDNGKPFPFADHSFSVIVASLSLHYFTWTVTMQIASELKRCLKADGILLARFNSTNDVNYGAATPEPPIEPNLYFLGTMTKRFFDETAVRSFLQGWDIQFLEENTIDRYEKPKSVWEVLAQT
ncbi:MAG: class I SAM-dependent methyltransferase [Anaerolineales bacterium]|nr:class I SAM-dependent methyltransferase [Anaerolineales bacterium]